MVNRKSTEKRHLIKKKTVSKGKAHKKTNSKNIKNLHHVIKKKLNITHEIPLGIRVFLTYLGMLSIFYFFSAIITKKAVIFGMSFEGAVTIVLNLMTSFLIVGLIYGFAKKEIRYYYFSLTFFSLVLVNALLSIFTIRIGTVGTIRELVNIIFFLTIIVNVITLIFIVSKKYYFLHPKPEYHVHINDKIFIVSLIVLWGLILFSAIFFVNKYYDESFFQADMIIDDLQNKGVVESLYYCNQNTNPDLCHYIGALMNQEDSNALKLCEKIRLPIFANDCVRSVQAVSYN